MTAHREVPLAIDTAVTRSEEQALTDALLHLDYIERYGAWIWAKASSTPSRCGCIIDASSPADDSRGALQGS